MSDESRIKFHYWSLKDKQTNEKLPNISFHSLKYSDKCLYVWIGDYNCKMENLSCAIKTPYERDPTGIEIMLANEELNNNTNSVGKDVSIKLAKKLNKQVFVSFNVAHDLLEQIGSSINQIDANLDTIDLSLMQIIERSLFNEVKLHPEMF